MRRFCKIAIVACLTLAIWLAVPGVALRAQDAAPPGSLFSSPDEDDIQLLTVDLSLFHLEYADLAAGFETRRLVYMVQDAEKAVRGRLVISFSSVIAGGEPCTELKKEYTYPLVGVSRLEINAETLSPVNYRLELFDATEVVVPEDAEPAEVWTSQYYHDIVTVRMDAGDTSTFYSFRHPLKAYDLDELFLLFSQLAVERFPAKCVLFVTAPFQHRNYAVLLERLGRKSVYGADAERHICEHLRLTFSDFTEDYYVETLPPYRVVKFTAGELAFTLLEDETIYTATPAAAEGHENESFSGGVF